MAVTEVPMDTEQEPRVDVHGVSLPQQGASSMRTYRELVDDVAYDVVPAV